jgi:eukaryotic-like serine/threonine-protein kinase
MGFLKSLKYILYSLLLLSAGCATSLIKTEARRDDNAYPGFGKNPSRDFFINTNISDSISLKWENSANGGFTNSSVAVYDSLVFVNDLSGRIYCYNLVTGKKVGQLKNEGSVFSSPFINKFSLIYADAIDDENITRLKYYDYVMGEMKHDIEVEGRCVTEIIGTPDAIIFNTEDGNVYKYDMYGNEVWKTSIKSSIHSSPSMNNGIIVFGNDDGEIIGIRNKDGKILYRKKTGKSFFCGTASSGDLVYAGNDNGNLYAFELKTGKVIWHYDSGARIVMTPSIAGSQVYFGNLRGDLFGLNKSDGKLIWKTSTGGVLKATPFIAENLLVVPDLNKKFYFVNRNNGEITRTYFVDGRNELSPVIFRNTLFIGFDRGELQAYEFK